MRGERRYTRLRAFGIAAGIALAITGLCAGVLEAGKAIGGTPWDYAIFPSVGLLTLTIGYGVVRSLSKKRTATRVTAPVINGSVFIPAGEQGITRRVDLDEGDILFGTLCEARERPFRLSIRSRQEQRKARKGRVSVTIGEFKGISTTGFQSQIPAPSDGPYYIEFSHLDEQTGREVVVDLRRRTIMPEQGPPEDVPD